MIISCPNCNKQFKINLSLIPDTGRDLKCGSCDHLWFYKTEDNKTEPLPLRDSFADKGIDNKIVENINEPNDLSLQKELDNKIDKTEDKIAEKQILPINKIKKNTSSGKFFSYLLVSIISFVALIILIDTLKVPLINIFPGLEILLFNLFEILKDIKLFIIDLK